MSQKKKQVRESFRQAVFKRDGNKCRMCGKSDGKLDAHHIYDRTLMPGGGYVPENGITLCDGEDGCHMKAEKLHSTGTSYQGYSPEDLYKKIGSSYEKALEASRKLA